MSRAGSGKEILRNRNILLILLAIGGGSIGDRRWQIAHAQITVRKATTGREGRVQRRIAEVLAALAWRLELA
ncbi:MAG: hypothetical protein IPM17_00630 [Verrucomicrobia bacterium]|nr:hypothetical protein [Verrucomicrobiota bacterium]